MTSSVLIYIFSSLIWFDANGNFILFAVFNLFHLTLLFTPLFRLVLNFKLEKATNRQVLKLASLLLWSKIYQIW